MHKVKAHLCYFSILYCVAALLSMVVVTACSESENITTDELEAQTPVSSQPEVADEVSTSSDTPGIQTLVSLAPSNTELLFALGLEERIVGVTEYCDYPPEARQIAQVGGFSTVDMEKIIELDPDLIFAANMHKETDVPELKRRGFTVITLAPETIDDVLSNVVAVGEATGTQDEAAALIADMSVRINSIKEKLIDLTEEEKPGVFYITWHDPLWTLGKGTITHELIELSGGTNIAADIEGHGQTDLETLIWRNPQVILASSGHGSGEDAPINWAKNEKRLEEIDARINGRIFQVDSDLVTRPGPRIIDGLELIAELIHPELFGE